MSRATYKSQHFAGYYSVTVNENRAVRRKECGTVLTSVGETRQSRMELISCGIRSWWTGDCETFVRFDTVLGNKT